MQVERQFEEVKQRQVVIELPDSFINHRMDAHLASVDRYFASYPELAARLLA